MSAPNDTTKFSLAWLIIWILVSTVLLVLAALRKLTLPAVIKGGKPVGIVFVVLQVAVFALTLAALAYDTWSQQKLSSSYHTAFGVVKQHERGSDSNAVTYSCSGLSGDDKNMCETGKVAGAFTLIFGLIAVIDAFILTVVVIVSQLGKATPIDAHVPVLANVQWIALQACVIIWSVSFHTILVEEDVPELTLGASWILAIVALFVSIVNALFFSAGTGAAVAADQPTK